jgi:predicted aldo/keto reductase-like oxidoreductase
MRLPLLDGNDPTSFDKPQICGMVDAFLDAGFTYFDTAYMYHNGKSEEMLREALTARHPRDSFFLADKLPTMFLKQQADVGRIFREQLTRTGAQYFDNYLLHCLDSDNYPRAEQFDCFNFVLEMKQRGLVRHFGFSFHDTPELLDEILTKHPEVEFVQLQINYLDWESEWIQSRKCYETAVKHGKPVVVMEPVKGGTLARVPAEAEDLFREKEPGMSIPSWAIRFVASLDNVMVVLSGMSSVEQLDDNTSYMKDFRPLNEEEKEICFKAAEIINSQIAVPCTGCRYCTEGCPMHICIPDYFSLYNEDMREDLEHKGWTINFSNYHNLNREFGKASDCIECGQCEGVCPQHLPIIDLLKDVKRHFEH